MSSKTSFPALSYPYLYILRSAQILLSERALWVGLRVNGILLMLHMGSVFFWGVHSDIKCHIVFKLGSIEAYIQDTRRRIKQLLQPFDLFYRWC